MYQYYCNGKQNQIWEITKDTNSNLFKFSNGYSSKCWDDWGANEGETLRQQDCVTGDQQNQQFTCEPAEEPAALSTVHT